jgi:cytidylate kinase-like protein
VKAAAFGLGSPFEKVAIREYPLLRPAPGQAVQDPARILSASGEALAGRRDRLRAAARRPCCGWLGLSGGEDMSSGQAQHRPVVTIAALYGAAGTVIGPRVANQLGVPYLDRAVPEAVAKRTGLTEAAVADVDEEPRTLTERLVSSLGRTSTMSGGAGGSSERLDFQERNVRAFIEQALAEARVSGGVVLGRGGMVVLSGVPWALHVFLGGPREARVRQRMALEGIDQPTAEERQRTTDRSRIAYVRRAYGVDGLDPDLYHLMIDSTAIDLDTCVKLIVEASRSRIQHQPATAAT